MVNVYYINIVDFEDSDAVSRAAQKLFNYVVKQEKIELPLKMPLKVTFGELGNKTFIKPSCYSGVSESLLSRGIETHYIETNVLYKGERRDSLSHISLARRHGFTDLPIVIADDTGHYDIPICGKHFNKCSIGLKFRDYEGFIVMSHFKGHEASGFGGALKQLAMGFASRAGKLQQHTNNTPFIKTDRCSGCKKCLDKCAYEAISINEVAELDSAKCVGCAICVGICPRNAIKIDWNASFFQEKLAEYAMAAVIGKNNIYINFLGQITEQCDCVGRDMKPVVRDIGIFASTDPVAIDTACLEALPQETRVKFKRGAELLAYAQNLGIGISNQIRKIEIN
ncbi:MAG: DUF362 domain-containing protein [Oscillospiraceae bacterium]|jgi:uncharacterized Fe-S center protein|nr:DUF362 domain-containing protein [Oscillospiraceae bacterium]